MKSAFKRFRLIDDDEFQRQKMKQIRDYNPEIMGQAKREIQVEDILNNKTLLAEEKLRLIGIVNHSLKQAQTFPETQLQQQHKVPINYRQILVPQQSLKEKEYFPHLQKEFPIARVDLDDVQVIPEPQVPEPEESPDEDIQSLQNAIGSIAKADRKNATKMYEYLQASPGLLKVNDKNEISVAGEEIPKSNIYDILRFVYNRAPKQHSPPIGYSGFVQALANAKVPSEFIGNQKTVKKLNDLKSHDSSFPSSTITSSHSLTQTGTGKPRKKIVAYAKPRNFANLKLYKI